MGINATQSATAQPLAAPAAITDFQSTWTTVLDNHQISVFFGSANGTATIDWGDGTANSTQVGVGEAFHTYTTAGDYTVKISGDLSIYSDGATVDSFNSAICTAVTHWGSEVVWASVVSMFEGGNNIVFTTTDAPDLSNCNSTRNLFWGCSLYNQSINNWGMSPIQDTVSMFRNAVAYNQPMNLLDMSNNTDMDYMLNGATLYNQDLTDWVVTGNTTNCTNFYAGSAMTTANLPLLDSCSLDGSPTYDGGPLVLPIATEGVAYSFQSSTLFTGTVTSYTMPTGDLTGSGLSYNTSTGELSGTPLNTTDVAGISFYATNGSGNSPTSNTATLVINAVGSSVITSITGTIADGESVVINGSGFGTMGGDVIQYGKGGEAASGTPTTDVTPTVGVQYSTFIIGLGDDATGQHLFTSNANNRTGRTGTYRRRSDNGSGTNRNGGFGYNGRDDPELFISYWRYLSPGAYTLSEVNYKQYYVFANGTSGTTSGVPQPILHIPAGGTWYAMYGNTGGGDTPVYTKTPWTSGSDTENKWQRWDSYLKLGAGGRNGAFKIGRDNESDMERSSYNWLPANVTIPPTGFKDFRLGYMDTRMNDAVHDFTDVYVATTQARVEIGNASTFTACTHLEIQLARNVNWGSTAVTAVLDKGSFASYSGSYLYVIDSSGNVIDENGYAL